MEKTPQALCKHVVLLGSTNAGKSTLFNALIGQDGSIVSAMPGTTTDPVRAAMELIPYGPIVLVDTAGLGDDSELGDQRMQKTHIARRRADAALYVADATAFDQAPYAAFLRDSLAHLLVFTKCDLVDKPVLDGLHTAHPDALFLAAGGDIDELRARLATLLERQQPEETTLVGDLVPPGSNVVLVTPVDAEAPKGRLILPQIQVLRDCLDHGTQCVVCRETELESALANQRKVDLVVTDSQVFVYVNARVPADIPLTSFSMLLARQKGNFDQLLAGVEAAAALPDNGRVLMLEGCTHNHTHEDIGRVKIPALLQRKMGKYLRFDYYSGYDFPEEGELAGYDLVVQCGSCMINRREVTARLSAMAAAGLPVTNYGILLAWCGGILERCAAVFRKESGA